MSRELKKENGSVTIEATIALTAFMFAIVTILTIVNICVVQARISYGLNTTAKEISQYSYLYSLTGLNKIQSDIYDEGVEGTKDISKMLSDINEVYTEIENLGQEAQQPPNDINGVLSKWDSVIESVQGIEGAGSSLYDTISDIAKDPKNLMFGIAKLALSKGFDLVKSRLIAAPLTKVMMKRHLVSTKGGDVESYLKSLGVIPAANGSYLDGLDFTKSSLFPEGSGVIRLNVSYDVKVIELLPIDFSFHFNQTAVTHGWPAGEQSFQSGSTFHQKNKTLWTKTTVEERASFIRHELIDEMVKGQGYAKTSGLTDVQLYNKDKKEFVMIASMNPLWSAPDDDPRTLDDLSDAALKDSIERLCGKMTSTTSRVDRVTLQGVNGGTVNCSDASDKLVLVIPEDKGLKEKIESIIAAANTKGVTIEVVPRYGNGATSTKVKKDEGATGE